MGRAQRKGSSWTKGKGLSNEPHGAVAKNDTYLLDVLRAYPADDGAIFVKRLNAARDADLVSMEGMAARLTATNAESHRRPGKWLSMLAASVAEAGRTAQYVVEHPENSGLRAFADKITQEVLDACAVLDSTKRLESTPSQREAAILTLLDFAADEEAEASLTRVALMAAKLYVGVMQTLQADGRRRRR